MVQDALPFRGGAENVLEAALELLPNAPVYTTVYGKKHFQGTPLDKHVVLTSFIDRLPGAHSNHYRYAPLFPWAVERFDLSGYDAVLSFSYAFAHGIIPEPEQLHVSYMYTPLRYAWRRDSLEGSFPVAKARLLSPLLHYLRLWDVAASMRVDHFITVSKWIATCIRRSYRRRAEVIYPPVDVDRFQWSRPRGEHYIAVTRLAPHKRVGIIVDAFSRLGHPLYVVGDGPERDRLAERAAANVHFLGHQPDSAVAELLGNARGFVHTAEEDFGIALVEAQAAGCPVIAYGRGASREIVIEGKTGILFEEQSAQSLMSAVRSIEEGDLRFDPGELRRNAERFRKERFQHELKRAFEREWDRFRRAARR